MLLKAEGQGSKKTELAHSRRVTVVDCRVAWMFSVACCASNERGRFRHPETPCRNLGPYWPHSSQTSAAGILNRACLFSGTRPCRSDSGKMSFPIRALEDLSRLPHPLECPEGFLAKGLGQKQRKQILRKGAVNEALLCIKPQTRTTYDLGP